MKPIEFERLRPLFPGGDALLILPPFAGIERPSLGLHVLQAVAAAAGLRVDVFNANVHFSDIIGEEKYMQVCYAPTGVLSGEKIFAPVAFPGVRPLCDPADLDVAREWCDALVDFVASLPYPVIGCNTMFEQLMCSLGILSRLKTIAPHKITIIGGAQCEDEMGQGILSLDMGIDFVFSGESERTFTDFLRAPRSYLTGSPRLIEGTPLMALESLPPLDYRSYFEQFRLISPASEIATGGLHWIPLEGSRGCWWGQKHHCTFCGINGNGMAYRMKGAERMMSEIKAQTGAHGCKNILMVDNIMPHDYFSTLLPMLADARLDLRIFYEQKANLTAARMRRISDAGINIIQPGIESLSDDLLVLMRKGVKSWQNIAALRHARMCDVYVNWNLLTSFPGDRISHYKDQERLVPLLHHLCPPSGLNQLSIDRFSPYFDTPERFGITNIRPMASYYDIFPSGVDVPKLAYHFHGDYASDVLEDPELLSPLARLVGDWVASWENNDAPPVLCVNRLASDTFLVTDTRAVAPLRFRFVDRRTARAALFAAHHDRSPEHEWCLAHGLCIEIDGVVVPLATTSSSLYEELATEADDDLQVGLEYRPPHRSAGDGVAAA
jgi:ribosomal peptide maturation radical SAM protein 1